LPDRLLTRRRFLAASAAGAAALAANAGWIEPNRLQVTEHVLGRVTSGRRPMRLAQLSDLHLQRVGRHEERIAEAVHGLSPDLVILSGDVIDRADRLDTLRSFLSLLPSSGEACAILGNWEHWAGLDLQGLERLYEAHGVQLLVNRTTRLEHERVPVLLTGMDDATGGRPDLGQALAGVQPSANHLLLAHSPVYRDQMAHEEGRPEPPYMLSGHTHGGQVNLFGWAPFRPPGSGRYVRGWYRDRHPHLYVSQGLGTSVLPARFGAVPEIASFTWHLSSPP
jgi:predicted MPP superfamily phosphohydrolase